MIFSCSPRYDNTFISHIRDLSDIPLVCFTILTALLTVIPSLFTVPNATFPNSPDPSSTVSSIKHENYDYAKLFITYM